MVGGLRQGASIYVSSMYRQRVSIRAIRRLGCCYCLGVVRGGDPNVVREFD